MLYSVFPSDFRFMAAGESFRSLAIQFHAGYTTIGNIVKEGCDALWLKLSSVHMRMPQGQEEWMVVADNFMNKWHFPNCVGAMDGKHVVIRCPKK